MAIKKIRPHWDTRLFNDFLLSRAKTPFTWGTHDCATFAADGIQAITGVDIAVDFRGKYTDQPSAVAAIKSICNGATVADAAAYCAQKYGLVELAHPRMARRGDLVIVPNNTGELIAGLVHLNGRDVVSVNTKGWIGLPITSVQRAWHYE